MPFNEGMTKTCDSDEANAIVGNIVYIIKSEYIRNNKLYNTSYNTLQKYNR